MTITPEQADRLKQAATSVPWTVHIDSNDVDEIYIYSDDGNMCIGIDLRGSYFTSHDLNLAAAAPDLAQTIAGMEWQWGVERAYRSGTETAVMWFSSEDDARQEIDNPHRQNGNPRLVRRLVGPVEEAE